VLWLPADADDGFGAGLVAARAADRPDALRFGLADRRLAVVRPNLADVLARFATVFGWFVFGWFASHA
jgi:hypothetical protein